MANGFSSTGISSLGLDTNLLTLGYLSNRKGSTVQINANDEKQKTRRLKQLKLRLSANRPECRSANI